MYREISHTADEAYEITFSDEDELFTDLIDIINKKVIGKSKERVRKLNYELSGNITDDVFDVANDMIYMVDTGWVPEKAIVKDGKVSIIYRESDIETFDFKALTYFMDLTESGNKKIIKVVFDV